MRCYELLVCSMAPLEYVISLYVMRFGRTCFTEFLGLSRVRCAENL